MKKKDIIRVKMKGNKILIMRGVTLKQAQEWCSSELTRGKGFFDSYDDTNIHCIYQNPKYTHYFAPNKEYH